MTPLQVDVYEPNFHFYFHQIYKQDILHTCTHISRKLKPQKCLSNRALSILTHKIDNNGTPFWQRFMNRKVEEEKSMARKENPIE